ncbi:ABC transporter permease subunit [Histophilus somni]|uniref:ABC transporter permease subunit n=1 Tax=Histophilus somni TaxID=731 RepID=UPI00094B0B14|nr:ABC transporter permease subunit [Histophilus somni]
MSRLLRNIFLFVVYAYLYIPIIILISNSFNNDRFGNTWKGFGFQWYERLFNNDTLIQAAIHSITIAFFAGAGEVTILRKIILPLALPAIVSGWLLSFTISLDDVVVSSFVSGVSYEILPLKIFSLVKTGVTPEVNALATLMIIFSLILVILSQLVAKKGK